MKKSEFLILFERAIQDICVPLGIDYKNANFKLFKKNILLLTNASDVVDEIFINEIMCYRLIDIGILKTGEIFVRISGHNPIPFEKLKSDQGTMIQKYGIPIVFVGEEL